MCEECDSALDYYPEDLEETRKRVADGIKHLDEQGPKDWRERVNLDILDIDSVNTCVLGQVYRNNSTGESGYFYWGNTLGNYGLQYVLGFIGDYENGVYTSGLTEAWREALSAEN